MHRTRGRGEDIADKSGLLQALGECRRALIAASDRVRPFGPTYHATHMVVTAIDALAHYLTGEPYHFSVGGSTPPQKGPMEV